VRRAAVLVALLALVAPATASGKAEFRADCRLAKRVAQDPIVHPGKKRAGHLHDFLGRCDPAADRSLYWVPTLFAGTRRARALTPAVATIYYSVEDELAHEVRPFPKGLRMIAGNARERGRVPGAPNVWSCLGGGPSGGTFVRCPGGGALELLLDFPDCWDGRRLDSRDHQSHMAYSVAHACPASHPVAVPQLQFKIRWPTRGGSDRRLRLASGNGYSAHGDFINRWEPAALQQRIDDCLKPLVKCGPDGRPLG
jgi:uncharacterized protein DUF1996